MPLNAKIFNEHDNYLIDAIRDGLSLVTGVASK